MNSITTLGERLQELRKDCGMTQQEVGVVLNCAASTIGGYEIGKNEPAFDVLVRLANLYSVSTDYILGLTKIKSPYLDLLKTFKYSNGNIDLEELINTILKLSPPSIETLLDVINSLSVRDNLSKGGKPLVK